MQQDFFQQKIINEEQTLNEWNLQNHESITKGKLEKQKQMIMLIEMIRV